MYICICIYLYMSMLPLLCYGHPSFFSTSSSSYFFSLLFECLVGNGGRGRVIVLECAARVG